MMNVSACAGDTLLEDDSEPYFCRDNSSNTYDEQDIDLYDL